MEEKKLAYMKPNIRVVECDYNESICNNVITNSFNACIKVTKESKVNYYEQRNNVTGDWHWTGSK